MATKSVKPAPRGAIEWLSKNIGGTFSIWVDRLPRLILGNSRVDVTLDPASVSANTTAEEEFTVTGAREGDGVIITKPSHTAGLGIGNARVSGTDKVSITFINATGSPIDPPEEIYRVWLIRWNES